MIQKLLNAKPLQIFLFIIIIPTLLLVVALTLAITESDDPIPLNTYYKSYWWIPLLALVVYGLRFAWMWSIGAGLNKYLPKGVWLNVKKFKWFLVITFSAFVVLFGWMSYEFLSISLLTDQQLENEAASGNAVLNVMMLMVMFQMFALYALLYCFKFIASTVKSIELGRVVSTNHYIGYLFGFLFPYIGVWFIQPIINQIEDGTLNPPTPNEDKSPFNKSSSTASASTELDLLD